jgi:glycosyltransferase involved in cell wall biosynthesis
MLISVIIPVYNGERFLAEAVESIRKQDVHSLEIIIVDDGSTDGTASLIPSLGSGICYAYQPNQGVAAARNHGLALAQGEVIAFLDADDLWPNTKFARQLPILLNRTEIDIVLGKVQRLWRVEGSSDPVQWEARIQPWTELLLGCGLFRRSVFERIGHFNPNLSIGEDTDWFLRARVAGIPTVDLDEITLFYRRHEESLTARVDHNKTTIFPILKLALQRHRQVGASPNGTKRDLHDNAHS